MENITATTPSQVSHPRLHLVISALRRAGELVFKGVKAVGAGMIDPMTCSAYWIGSSPYVWGAKK